MDNENYTKEEIEWALAELKRKRPESEPTKEQAVKLLDTFGKFKGMIAGKIGKDTKKSRMDRVN